MRAAAFVIAAAALALLAPATSAYVQPPVIRIGHLFSNVSSGVDAMLGNARDFGTALKLAVDTMNEENFIPGSTIELYRKDVQNYLPSLAVYGALEFIQTNNVHCIIGPQQIAPTRVVAGIAGALGVPHIGFATDEEMASRVLYPTYYRMQPSMTYNYDTVFRLMSYLKFDRIAVIDTQTSVYPSSFFAEAARRGIEIISYVTLNPSKLEEIPSIVATLKASRARIFHSAVSGAVGNAFLNASYHAGIAGPEYVWFGNRAEVSWAQANRQFQGLMSVVFGVTLTDPTYVDYFARYNATYDDVSGEYPHAAARSSASAGPITALAWDAAYVYATVAKDLIARELDLNAANFQAAMLRVNYTGASGPLTFESNGDRNMPLHLKTVRYTPSGSFAYDLNAEVFATNETITFRPFVNFTWPSGSLFTFPHTQSPLVLAQAIEGVPPAFSCINPCVHGVCVAEDTCQCDDPELWSGATCDHKKYIEWSDAGGQAILGISIAFMAFTLIVLLILFIHRSNPAVRKSSATFCMLMAVGFIIGYASMLTYVGKPDERLCRAQLWVPTMAFALVFANLLAKTWRINLIFNNSSLKILHVRDSDLLRFSLGLILVDSIILIVWSAGFAPGPIDVVLDGGESVTTCGSSTDGQSQTILMAVLLAFNLLLVVVAAVLAYRTRKVNYSYRESRFIGYAVYNILFCAVVFLALILALPSGTTISFALKQLVTWLMVTVTLFVLLVPKVWMVLRYTPEQQAEMFESKERKHGYSGSNAKHSSHEQPSKTTGMHESAIGSPGGRRSSHMQGQSSLDGSVALEMTKKSSEDSGTSP